MRAAQMSVSSSSQFHIDTMQTRHEHEVQREFARERKRKQMSTEEGRQKHSESCKRARLKKKVEHELMLMQNERLMHKVESLKRKVQKLEELMKEKNEHIEFLDACLEKQREEDVQKLMSTNEVQIEDEIPSVSETDEHVRRILSKESNYHKLVRLNKDEFNKLVLDVSPSVHQMTFRGTSRKKESTDTTKYSIECMVFITLFWLAHYPTLNLMSLIFQLHERSITQILKRTLVGMKEALQNRIQWPTDEEFESKLKDFTFFQNADFSNVACVVDGSEIRISRPSKEPFQRQVWSGKKKQHSLNVMFVTWLNGEIIYFSPARIGAHDQSHWNELHLRDRFVRKNFGICGDGGFTFNRKTDTVQIKGYKPHAAPKGGKLTEEQKKYNKHLSQMRVVVENSIARVKQWKVLKGVFRHWRNGQGQLDIDAILTVAIVLANQKMKQRAPRPNDWVAPEWFEVFGGQQVE
jgi:hypothetical protein